MTGVVYLVGAGPGDPGLLTLRGRECIAEADVIIHDYLVDPRMLRFARPRAEIGARRHGVLRQGVDARMDGARQSTADAALARAGLHYRSVPPI